MFLKLDELDLNILSSVEDCIGVDTQDIKTIDDEKYIDKDTIMGILQDFVCEYRKLQDEVEAYKENYRPIGEESAWDVAFCYQHALEEVFDYLEAKGLKEEYERRNKS